jgi:RND family efflux transporter MFP subunit
LFGKFSLLLFLVCLSLLTTKASALDTALARQKVEPVYIFVPAKIVSSKEVGISTKIAGFVKGLKIDIGDVVKKGDTLLFIDKNTANQRLEQARQNIKKAKAQLENAQFNYDKFSSLYKMKAVSKKQFLDVETEYNVAKSAYKQALSALSQAETNMNYSIIKSPIDGVISEKFVDNGDLAAMNKILMKISSLKNLQVESSVGFDVFKVIKNQKKIKVKVNDKIFIAKLTHISLVSNPVSKTFKIKADLACNEDIYPGEFAYLLIESKTKKILVIDKDTLTKRGGMNGVFVVGKDNRVYFRIVVIGRRYGRDIEILSGLFPKEKVILNPPLLLKNAALLNDEK